MVWTCNTRASVARVLSVHLCISSSLWFKKYACFFVLWFILVMLLVLNTICFTIFFRVASQALGQSYDCPSASEVTLKDMGNHDQCLNTTNHGHMWNMCIIFWKFCATFERLFHEKLHHMIYYVHRLFQANNKNIKSYALWMFCQGIHWWLVISPHKGAVVVKTFHVIILLFWLFGSTPIHFICTLLCFKQKLTYKVNPAGTLSYI